MLKLIQTEFMKLRRRKIVWIMLLAAFIMPFFTLLYFSYFGKVAVDAMQFYKMSAYGFTLFIILPVVLGIFSTMLMYNENQYDMPKQLWIVPVKKMKYFFSKFFVVMIYSVSFMIVTAVASAVFGLLSGYVAFEWLSIISLFDKCIEIGILTALAILPILAIAASQSGYILPICITLVYAFLGFILGTANAYLHPLLSMAAIINRNNDIPGIVASQSINVPLALICIFIWDVGSIFYANFALKRRK